MAQAPVCPWMSATQSSHRAPGAMEVCPHRACFVCLACYYLCTSSACCYYMCYVPKTLTLLSNMCCLSNLCGVFVLGLMLSQRSLSALKNHSLFSYMLINPFLLSANLTTPEHCVSSVPLCLLMCPSPSCESEMGVSVKTGTYCLTVSPWEFSLPLSV